ncbi:MAG: YjfB family protein [Rhodocyclaceae bacterium]|nr:YjfB family protein [Rhodocyclaceae bacterium]
MDVSSASAASLGQIQAQAATAVQSKALDIQAQTAQQLVNSLPEVQPVPDPNASVGSRVDIFV